MDLVLDMNIDPQTAAKIKELNRKKALAVEREDYDEAKLMKNAIERLKAVGAKVAQLEARCVRDDASSMTRSVMLPVP